MFEVDLEFAVGEPVEDRDELGGLKSASTAGAYVELTGDFDGLSLAALDGGFVVVGALGVSEDHEVVNGGDEIFVAEMFGVVEQDRDELGESVSNPIVRVSCGEHRDLG